MHNYYHRGPDGRQRPGSRLRNELREYEKLMKMLQRVPSEGVKEERDVFVMVRDLNVELQTKTS